MYCEKTGSTSFHCVLSPRLLTQSQYHVKCWAWTKELSKTKNCSSFGSIVATCHTRNVVLRCCPINSLLKVWGFDEHLQSLVKNHPPITPSIISILIWWDERSYGQPSLTSKRSEQYSAFSLDFRHFDRLLCRFSNSYMLPRTPYSIWGESYVEKPINEALIILRVCLRPRSHRRLFWIHLS